MMNMDVYLEDYYIKNKKPGMYFLNRVETVHTCKFCHSENIKIHSVYNRKVYDYDSGAGEMTELNIRVRRYRCMDCMKTFNESSDVIEPYSRVTKRLKNLLLTSREKNHSSYKKLADQYDIPVKVVCGVCCAGSKGV